MSDSWIKICKNTPEKMEVLEMSMILGIEDVDSIVGKLVRVWSWIDSNVTDGVLPKTGSLLIDRMTGQKGFTNALASVGWLEKDDDYYIVSNFERHLGNGAKKRQQAAERKRKQRAKEKAILDNVTRDCHANVTQNVTKKCDENVTIDKIREDKIREDKNILVSGDKSPKRPKFKKPSVDEISNYLSDIGKANHQEAERIHDYYESNGWKVSRNPMKDWKAAVRGWIRRSSNYNQATAKHESSNGQTRTHSAAVDKLIEAGRIVEQMQKSESIQ